MKRKIFNAIHYRHLSTLFTASINCLDSDQSQHRQRFVGWLRGFIARNVCYTCHSAVEFLLLKSKATPKQLGGTATVFFQRLNLTLYHTFHARRWLEANKLMPQQTFDEAFTLKRHSKTDYNNNV